MNARTRPGEAALGLEARQPADSWSRAVRAWGALALLAALALGISIAVGSGDIPVARALRLAFAPDASAASDILHELRIPRALAAFAAGGLLAVAGALMQALLRNPLADPYVLGLSSGASVGALGAMLLGLGAFLIDAGALLGAAASLGLVFVMARGTLEREGAHPLETTPRLLLTGVILASGWSAIVTVMLVVAPDQRLRGMLFWLMGDLAGAERWGAALAALGLALAALLPVGRALNVMLLGEDAARSMGVDTARVRRLVLLVASAATALAVTTAGAVGFVGLVVPHALRLVLGNDQRVLLPASACAGGALLVLADTLARSAFAPQQVPVGAVTAILGVPTFLYLLLRRGGRP